MKAKVSLKLAHLTANEVYSLGVNIVQKMESNAEFPSPLPELLQVSEALNDLNTAIVSALDGSKINRALLQERLKICRIMLTQLGHYVDYTANGSESIIFSAGMEVKKNPIITTPPVKPLNLSVERGTVANNYFLYWDRVPLSKCYVVYKSTDPNLSDENWIQHAICFKGKLSIDLSSSTQRHWFKVQALNGIGNSPYSDPATTPEW